MATLGSRTIVVWPIVVFAAAALVIVSFFVAPRILRSIGTMNADPVVTRTPTPDVGVPLDEHGDGVTAAPTGIGGAVPFISRAILSSDKATVTIYSFVPGVTENGGICTGILKGDGADRAVTTVGVVEVANTVCPPLVVPLSQPMSADDLTVRVEYESLTVTGKSISVKVTAP